MDKTALAPPKCASGCRHSSGARKNQCIGRTSRARRDRDKRLLSKATSAATTKLLDEVGLSPDVPLAPALRGGAARPVLLDPPRQLGSAPRGPAPGVRRAGEHPFHPEEAGVLHALEALEPATGRAVRRSQNAAYMSVSSSKSSPF